MRRALVAAMLLGCACAATQMPSGYLNDASSRRASLEASLVNKSNDYSTLRLAHYSTGKQGDWDELPAWNPPASPLSTADLGNPRAPLSASASPLAIDPLAARGDHEALRALGRAAFSQYPVQIAYAAEAILANGGSLADYGLSPNERGVVGGLVRVSTADGTHLAYTCATCHGGGLVGVANAKLDLGKLIADAARGADPRDAALLAWGPGRVDVTSASATEPVRIPDLRPIRHLGYLHATASVQQQDVTSLAIRLETLVIVSSGQTIRPPREVALGLATYLWSLADDLSPRAPSSDDERRGQAIFSTTCATCHAPPSFTGPPVALAVVGTDPVVGQSSDRKTGNYRVPSLLGVADRGALLHDASADSLDVLFDPSRTKPDYRGRLGKPIVGHEYGLALSPADRTALVAYLKTL